MNLSIVIPVYNTSIFDLNRCINSIKKISKEIKYEIILVDDGSKDENSEKYKKIKNIQYYYKENGGVSSARNYGIKKAKGDYIMFVDSDDILYADKITKNIFFQNYDLIIYNLKLENKNTTIYQCYGDSRKIDCLTIKKGFVRDDLFHSPCAKLYKRSFLYNNEIFFNTNFINGEDALFNNAVISFNPNCYYFNEVLYGYNFTIMTQDKRFKKFPKLMIDNCLNLLEVKASIVINEFNEDLDVKQKFYESYITQLFRCCINTSNTSEKSCIKKIKVELDKYDFLKSKINIVCELKKIFIKINGNFSFKLWGKIYDLYHRIRIKIRSKK